jgi:hypothetical protein
VKKLLVFVLFIGCASLVSAAAQTTKNDPPSPDSRAIATGHLDIPKNCQQTMEEDGSVLVTCECENCGQVEARDGEDPLPWTCVAEQGALHCGYGETEEYQTGGRQKSYI